MSPVNEVKRILGQFIEESSYLYCFVVNRQGEIVYSNPAFNSFFGFSETELYHIPFYELLDKKHTVSTELLITAVFKHQLRHKSEWEIVTSKGAKRIINLEMHLIDVTGNALAVGIIQDRTKEKELEHTLSIRQVKLEQINRMVQLKNEQLELAVSTAELGLWSYDMHSQKLIWNERQFELFEITPQEFEENHFLFEELMHPDDVAMAKTHLEKIKAEKISIPGYLYRITTRSGVTKHLLGSTAPILDANGELQEIHGVNIDLSYLIETQHLSEKKQKQLENITDAIHGVVQQYVLHPDGTDSIRYISKGVEKLYGIPHEVAKKDVSKVWELVLPEDVQKLADSIQASAKDLSPWELTFRVKTPAGKIKHLHGNGIPHKEDNGNIVWDVVIQDISQEIEQDRALAKQREMLTKLSNQVPGMVFIYRVYPDGKDDIYYISNGFEDIFESSVELVMQDSNVFWDKVLEEDVELLKTSTAKSKMNLSYWEETFRIKTPSGKIKHIRCHGTPHLLNDGTVQWYSMGSDITSFVEQQNELVKQQAQIQQIANQIPGVIIRIYFDANQNSSVEYISEGVEDMFGLTREEVYQDLGVFLKQHHEEDLPDILESMNAAAATESKWEHIHRYYDPNGNVRHMQAFGTPMKLDNGGLVWNIITLDITERVVAEQKANQTSSKLRAFINASPIAIYQIDSESIVTDFWNPSAELIFGWERDKVIGKRVPFITQENQKSFMDIIADIQHTSRPKQFPFAITNRFGEHLQLDITTGPIFDKHGKLTDLLIIANDITELEDYRKTIEKALREKEILLQEIHHRVKNNLAIVSGLLELQAMRNDSGKDLSLIIEARNRIHSIAMVHEQLYRDMDFSHINPEDYYKKLLSKLQANTVPEDREIDYDLKFEVDRININQAVPLGLLINELFTNSVKYAFQNGRGKLVLHFLRDGENISVHYADNGPGFKVADVEGTNTIGWQLIVTLLAQLDSEYTIDTDGKFDLQFSFKEVKRGSQNNLN